MLHLRDRIVIDPGKCHGRPTIRGQRITVHTILEYLGAGDAVEDILHQYPTLVAEDIYACLLYAADVMDRQSLVQPLEPLAA